MRRSLLLLALSVAALAGCRQKTGLMFEIAGPAAVTSTDAGITTLELVVGHPSWCDRWVGDDSANHTRIDVQGRDLSKNPYLFLLEPAKATDLSQLVYLAALAYGSDGQLLGEAALLPHPFERGEIRQYRARVNLFGAAARAGGPKYVADDGCVCVPGQPWVGNGSGSGCDTRIVTSFARLGDTSGCELPTGAALPVPACDGQQYGDEPIERALPCWADDGNGACRVGVRGCTDQFGVAYDSECSTSSSAPQLPSATLCAQYRTCQQTACGDTIGCFAAAFAQRASLRCILRLDGTTQLDEPIKPCGGGEWKAELPGGASMSPCVAALVEGTAQPPFHVGLVAAMEDHPVPVAAECPTKLWVESIDAPYPEAVPATRELDLVIGETLTHVTIEVVRSCEGVGGGQSLVCTSG